MSLFRAMATVGSLTMVSRILGFIRDILTAAYLGAGPIADAFFVALKLPNFFRRVTAEGAFTVSFVPMFSGFEEKQGAKKALSFAAEAQAMMLALLIPFTILFVIVMPWMIAVITPGFLSDPIRYDAAVALSRVTFPYILLISVVALYGGVLNAFGKFAAFAAAPAFFNLTLIAAIVGLTPYTQTVGHAMAYGVTLSGVIQVLWMLLNCYRLDIKIPLQKPKMTEHIKKLFRLMGPAILGAGVVQINLFIDMILASFLPQGSISYLYYADRLYQLPLAVIGIAIGTALLPMLAKKLKARQAKKAGKLLHDAIQYGLALAIPAAIALALLAPLIMMVLFQRGAFDVQASEASAWALRAYVVGLPAYILVKIFSTAFYADQDTKTPVKCAAIATVFNTVLSIILIQYLSHIGIALATGIAAWLNVTLLLFYSRAQFRGMGYSLKITVLKVVMASLVMAAVILFVQRIVPVHTVAEQILSLIMIVSGGMAVYFVLLHVTGVMNISEFKKVFSKPHS